MYREIIIQVIEECNLNCPYCFAKHGTGILHRKDAERFVSFCSKNHINTIKITGGEPFLYKDMFLFLESIFSNVTTLDNIIIFSNLTTKDIISPLPQKDKIKILVNVNDRDLYNEEQWQNLNNNLEDAKQTGMQLILGKTFYQDKFNFDCIVELAIKFNIPKIRVSQSSPTKMRDNIWLRPISIRKLCEFLRDQYEIELSKKNITLQFDCPISPCEIGYNLFDYFNALDAIKSKCKARLYVSCDMKVYHCYVTSDYIGGNSLFLYNTYESALEYLHVEEEKYRRNIDNDKCLNCRYRDNLFPCGCFSLMTERGVGCI